MRSRTGAGWLAAAVAGAVTATVAAALVGVPATGAAPAGARPHAAAEPTAAGLAGAGPAGAAGRRVTLLTGDRVTLPAVAGAAVSIRPAPGRERARFRQYQEHGDTFVVPYDAVPLVAAGRLDRRLFDVSLLVAAGYDDRSRADLPLIVTRAGDPAAARATAAGARPTRTLASIGATAMRADKAAAPRLWSQLAAALATPAGPAPRAATPAPTRIWLDGPVRPTLDRSVPQIGAPAAWRAGFTGRGVSVAVLDTGIDADHPDLADAVAAAQDFTGSENGTRDMVGHGTHVASIITGSGAASGGRYEGVAPDARLLVGKVLDDNGFGQESQIIAGMEWAVAQHARVVNMSLGTTDLDDGTGVIDQAIDRLSAESGTLFVVAAGNVGPSAPSVTSPGGADAALTVGAVNKQDVLAPFSSRGPRAGDGAVKPDITAPGVDIIAARAAGTGLGDPLDASYTRLSGTSMATPHVAGAAALLAQQHPDWTAGTLKAALMGSAAPAPGLTAYQQGTGRVDVARAVTQQVTASPATLNGGVVAWPHTDDQPVTRRVTYRNDGPIPVTLRLRLDVTGPTGQPAPAGMFRTGSPATRVPAHGTATVTVTADTRVAAPDGAYGGVLTATAGRTRVRTTVSVTREQEMHTLTVRVLGSDGGPGVFEEVRLSGLDRPAGFNQIDTNPTLTFRVPVGRYWLDAILQTSDGLISFMEPAVSVTADTSLVLDGRRARPMGLSVDRAGATSGHAVVAGLEDEPAGQQGTILIVGDVNDVPMVPSTTSEPGRFTFDVQEWLAQPDGSGGFHASPYLYHAGWTDGSGRVPVDLDRHVADRDMAVVHTRLDAQAAGTTGLKDGLVDTPLPATLAEYYSPGLPWSDSLEVFGADQAPLALQQDGIRTYPAAGPLPDRRWDAAVFGPGLPAGLAPFATGRDGVLDVGIPLFCDQAPDHAGVSVTDTAATVLYRDGALVGSTAGAGRGSFSVPPGPARYRLATRATRSGSDLSSSVNATWTFRFAPPAGGADAPLPLAAVRFAPPLDDTGQAPAGALAVPVTVQRQPGARYGRLTGLSVRVSWDDGATWQPAPLAGTGDHRTALLTAPRGARYASLSATATDSAGNQVQETIVHAYRLAAA